MELIQSTRPLLAKLAVGRTDGPDIPGRYSAQHDVWVVDTANGQQPLIEQAQKVLANLAAGPVTKAQSERDDLKDFALLETSTKTRAQLERDDQSGPSLGLVHELSTKTKVNQERDDEALPFLASVLELATKTDTKRERDDQ